MPGMRFESAGSGMVGCHNQYFRLEGGETRNVLIDLFDGLLFFLVISIFPGGIGFFEVDIEKIILTVFGLDSIEKFFETLFGMENCHADELG